MADAYRETLGYPPLVINRTSATVSVNLAGQMLTDRPEISRHWDDQANAGLDITTFRASAPDKVGWRCLVDPSHRWTTSIRSRCAALVGCPACGTPKRGTGRRNRPLADLLPPSAVDQAIEPYDPDIPEPLPDDYDFSGLDEQPF